MDKQPGRIVCIIPARGGSKGIPRKNIIDVGGKPLIAWSVLQGVRSKSVDGVYVSSDSDEILNVAVANGARAVRRPLEFANDTASSESAVLHALDVIESEAAKESASGPIEYVVFLQATSPVREWDDIDKAIETIRAAGADSLLSVQPLRDYFLWGREGDTHASLNFDYKNRKRRQDLPQTYLENGSIYIFKPEVLRKGGNRLGGKIAVYAMPKTHSQQIDDLEDLEFCDYLLRKHLS